MQWYLCPPLLYSKLSMEEFGKAEPSSQGGRTQKSPMIPNPTESSLVYPCGEGNASKRMSGSMLTFINA